MVVGDHISDPAINHLFASWRRGQARQRWLSPSSVLLRSRVALVLSGTSSPSSPPHVLAALFRGSYSRGLPHLWRQFGGTEERFSSPVSRDGVRHRRGRRARAPLGREGVDAALGGRRASPQTKTRRRNSERPDKRTKSRRPAVHKLSPIVGLLSRSRLVEHVPFGRVSYLGRLCEITLYTAGVRGGGRSPKRVRPSIRCYSRYLRVTGL